ncbi:PCNA-associated factor-like [Acanthaster planci]|uniref:PCNA-associated factor n=1 Tax=Acanthaster planci TaxID=133434 RepID=A0A8B7YUQ5_ACAPL|nr:PCNA-associated factor-like [Acanthaster planci]
MVRTKADNCARKAVAAKAPRKNLGVSNNTAMKAGSSMKSPAGKKGKYRGGNPVCPRPTPEWQKEITNFMIRSPRSATKQKENVDPEDGETSVEAGCSSKEDRTAVAQDSNNSSRVEDDTVPDIEETVDDDNETDMEACSLGASSSKAKFKKNNCISDSEDDD